LDAGPRATEFDVPQLEVNPQLVGRQVVVPHRPEWGSGTVLRVQLTTVGGRAVHRVSIQFATGHRTLQSPPAVLADPTAEPEREAGWLDTIGGRTVDDRLGQLPAALAEFLGTPAQFIVALAPLYELTDEPGVLIQWARRQANVADPLSLWSRDELAVAFRAFCGERDTALRVAAARLRQADGPGELATLLDGFPANVAEGMRAALRLPV
jgi:hypothetical protein